MAAEGFAALVAGILRGKDKKKIADEKKEAKVEKKEEKQMKKMIAYWQSVKDGSDDNSPANDAAVEMIKYWKGIDAGMQISMPMIPPDVLKAIAPDPDAITTSGIPIFDASKLDPLYTTAGAQGEKIKRAREVHRRFVDWFRGLSDTKRDQYKNNPHFGGIPTEAQVMENIGLYENQLKTYQGELTTATTEVSSEKAEYEHAKSQIDYKEGLQNKLDEHFAMIHLRLNLDELGGIGFNPNDPAQMEILTAANIMRRSNNANAKPITQPATSESLDDMFDLLVMYEEMFNEKYEVFDALWDTPLFSQDLEGLEIGADDGVIMQKYFDAQRKRSAGLTLRDVYDTYGIDNNEKVTDPNDKNKMILNKNYKKPVDNINEFIASRYPKVYEKVNIVSKEKLDLENAMAKKSDILDKIKSLNNSVLNFKFVGMDYVPQIDTREKIIDKRKVVKNTNFGQDKEVANKAHMTEIDNPKYDKAAAEEHANLGTQYLDTEEEIDDGVGGKIPNPYLNQIMSERIMDYRENILVKDEDEFLPNDTEGQEIDNPGIGSALVMYPFVQKEDED